MTIHFEPPAACEIAVLPDTRVKTRNGVPVEADMEFYYCYAPTKATAYRVLSDTAYRCNNNPWQVWVITANGYTMAINPLENSTDLSEWIEFYKKRNNGRLPTPPVQPYGFTGDGAAKTTSRKDNKNLNETRNTSEDVSK